MATRRCRNSSSDLKRPNLWRKMMWWQWWWRHRWYRTIDTCGGESRFQKFRTGSSIISLEIKSHFSGPPPCFTSPQKLSFWNADSSRAQISDEFLSYFPGIFNVRWLCFYHALTRYSFYLISDMPEWCSPAPWRLISWIKRNSISTFYYTHIRFA